MPPSAERAYGYWAPKTKQRNVVECDYEAWSDEPVVFDLSGAMTYLPFAAAPDAIHKQLKTYVSAVSLKDTSLMSTWHSLFNFPQKTVVAAIPREIEEAIASSEAILAIPVDPEEGITVPYTKETLDKAITLLREIAVLFSQDGSTDLPVPSIGPASRGSIDLFWEMNDRTLLVNIPSDPVKNATFSGRRFDASKISGTLDQKDVSPRHLTGWLRED